jgi:hypothetical protein
MGKEKFSSFFPRGLIFLWLKELPSSIRTIMNITIFPNGQVKNAKNSVAEPLL